jgi:amino acid permease
MSVFVVILKIIFILVFVIIGVILLYEGIFRKSGDTQALYILGGIAIIFVALYIIYSIFRDRNIENKLNQINETSEVETVNVNLIPSDTI